jgi:anti-sigma regulatory factor (Ser/Thr protein kinase)
VRVETTRTAGAVRLRHAVGFTEGFTTSTDDVVALAGPLVAAARGRDEPVALAVRPATARALAAVPPAEGLPGPDPGHGAAAVVGLSLPDGPDQSGQTLAARWARELRVLSRGRGGVTVVVEHDPDLDGLDGGFWTELDAALNVALADVAATVLCLYPQLPLHLEVTEGARRNHPLVLVRATLQHNPEHRGAREVLADRGGVPAPKLLGPPDQRMGFDTWQLVEVRDTVARAAQDAGCDRDRVADLVLAVNEVATNAVEHGSGDAHLALWTGPGSRELLCEVHDGGRLGDPLPGLRAPHPSDPRGRGLWIARQLCDLLHVWGDDAGTHVRIRALP